MHRLRGDAAVVRQAGQIHLSDAGVFLLCQVVSVPRTERALGSDLDIDARRDRGRGAWAGQCVGEVDLLGVGRIKRLGIDHCIGLRTIPVGIDKVRRILVKRTVDVPIHLGGVVGRLIFCERILGVESGVVADDEKISMHLIAPRLGEDFDHAVRGVGIVASRVGVLVDANLADRVFRRECAIREAIDVHGWRIATRHGLDLLLQLARLGGQIVDVFAGQNDRVAVLVRVGVVGLITGDVHLELLRLELKPNVQRLQSPGGDLHLRAFECRKTARSGLNDKGACREIREAVSSIRGGKGGLVRGSGRGQVERDLRLRDERAAWISGDAAHPGASNVRSRL